MIRKVTVYTGESRYAAAAQQHAIRVAAQFGARLRIVSVWDADENLWGEHEDPDSLHSLMEQSLGKVRKVAEEAGIACEEDSRGKGFTQGLIEEARETDLLVIGVPLETEFGAGNDDTHLLRHSLPVLRKAESALLVVNRPPAEDESLDTILVRYDANIAGKCALHYAGYMAEKFAAGLVVHVVKNRLEDAENLSHVAARYLRSFDLKDVERLPQAASKESKETTIEAAMKTGAGMIIIGDHGHGFVERLLGMGMAEKAALSTEIPILFAR